MKYTVEQLIKGITVGDRNAERELVSRYKGYCEKLFRSKHRFSKVLSEESSIDILFRLIKVIKSGNVNFNVFTDINKYINVMVRNTSIATYKKQQKEKEQFHDYINRTFSLLKNQKGEHKENLQIIAIWKAVDFLKTKNCSEIIKLRYKENQSMSLDDIAKELGYSSAKAVSEIHRRCIAELALKAHEIYHQLKNNK